MRYFFIKNKIDLKTGTVLFVLLVLSALIFINRSRGSMEKTEKNLIIGLPSATDISSYDPKNLKLATDYNFVRALFSPLVEYKNNNQINEAIADEFYWENDHLIFHIKDGLKTVDGYEINASDAYYSFKRLMIKDSNLHGDLYSILCTEGKIEDLQDKCTGLSYDDEKRLLKLKPKYKSPLLIALFTSIDFVVIPKRNFDNFDMKITDYRNTTGPYYYDGKDQSGNLVLKANNRHWHTSKTSPTKITVINDKLEGGEPKSYTLFIKGKLDSVPTFNMWVTPEYEKALEIRKNATLHKTSFISMASFRWTKKGHKITNTLRRKVGYYLQNIVHDELAIRNKGKDKNQIEFNITNQFFPNNAHGSLSDDRIKEGLALNSNEEKIPINFTLAIWINKSILTKMSTLLKKLPFDVKYLSGEDKGLADLVYVSQDISYEEDVSLISFCLGVGAFNAEDNSKWLSSFFQQEDASDRMKMLKDLHYRSVFEEPSVIPILYKRYRAISQNGWKMNFAKHWARSPYWQYSKED